MADAARAEGNKVEQADILPPPPPVALPAKVTPLCGRALADGLIATGTATRVWFLQCLCTKTNEFEVG